MIKWRDVRTPAELASFQEGFRRQDAVVKEKILEEMIITLQDHAMNDQRDRFVPVDVDLGRSTPPSRRRRRNNRTS